MINNRFLDFLEYELCKIFTYLENEETKDFWCDGVLLSEPENKYSQNFINDNKKSN
jgi:hypothetical protein